MTVACHSVAVPRAQWSDTAMTLIRGRTRVACQTRVGQWLPRRAFKAILMIGRLRVDLVYRPRLGYRAVSSWTITRVPGELPQRVEYER